MDRPEKFKYIVSTPNKKEDRFKFHEDCGYNRAIDDYDKWLEEVASVENLEKIMRKVGFKNGEKQIVEVNKKGLWSADLIWTSLKDFAKPISKSIIGK